MKKIFFKFLAVILIFVTGIIPAQGAQEDFNISIRAVINGQTDTVIEKSVLFLKRNNDEVVKAYKDRYYKLYNNFNSDHKAGIRLISQSSTAKQAFEHSMELLDTCIKHYDQSSELDSQILLELLVGSWNGTLDSTYKNTDSIKPWSLLTNLKLQFETDQAGIISKGVADGVQTIEIINNEDTQRDNTTQYPVSATINGNILPKSTSRIVITMDQPAKSDLIPAKLNIFSITRNNIIHIKPVVDQLVIDNAFIMTVSNMKIYYNLYFKEQKPLLTAGKERYKEFFIDIIHLLKIIKNNYVSSNTYKVSGIYPCSEYITGIYEDYVILRQRYYGSLISEMPESKEKINGYKSYLSEMMDLSGLQYVKIVDPKKFKQINLKQSINNIYYNYCFSSEKYFKHRLSTKNKELRATALADYAIYRNEIIAIAESGLINPEITKKLKITVKKPKPLPVQ